MSTCDKGTRGIHPDEENPLGCPQVCPDVKGVRLPDVPETNLASYVNVAGEQL
jgi:hypothetical protein